MTQTSLMVLNVLVIVQLHAKWMYMTIVGKVKGSLGQCFFFFCVLLYNYFTLFL